MSYLADELRSKIVEGDILVVVGAGVSIGATQGNKLATWKGLVEDGIKRCIDVRGMPAGRADLLRAEVQSGHIKDLLSAADKVSEELGFPSGAEYRSWLRETVGALKAGNRSVLEALRDLNLPLATTNYDGLLEEATGSPPVTWREGDKAIRIIKRQERGILHLHGFWDMPESVVLGIRSYEQILRDGHAQAVLQSLRTFKTFLFVGCGEGLSDPNFDALFRWAREVFRDVGGRHYRLCKESDLEALRSLHQDDHIHPLSYGPDHSGLAPYIRELGSFSIEGSGKKPNAGIPSSSVTHALRLPGRPQCYGRENEVRDLVETLLQPSPPPIPILGGPGAGKTTIILEALYDRQVTARFGARRFFVRCDAASSREALVGAIARAIGLKPGPDVEASLFLELATDPAVVVLDNAETPWEGPDKAAVSDLLADLGCVTGLALVASIRGNERPWGPSWRESIQAGPLDLSAARQAFLKKSGRMFEDDPDLTPLLEEVERLALAVVLLGHNAQAVANLAELRRQWQEKRTALLQRDGGQGPLENLEVSIELSISSSRMTLEARRLLSVLAHLPDGVALEALEALMPGEGGSAAVVLRRVGLALNLGTRVRVLAPVREYIQRRSPAEAEDLGRTIRHYLSVAAMGALVGRMGGAEAAGRIAEELGNVEAMLLYGLAQPDPEPAISGACQFGGFIRFTGLGSGTPLKRAFSVAQALGRDDLAGKCAERLGEIEHYRSDHDAARAHYEEALDLYRKAGDLEGETSCIKSLGNIALARSDHAAARARFEEALLLYRRVGSVVGEANCIRSLGDIALEHFEHEVAHVRFEESLCLYEKVGDLRGQARSIQSLGDIALLRSEHGVARARYEEARSLNSKIGDVLGEAHCLLSLGDAAFCRSDYDAACVHYEEALLIYRRLGAALGEANCAQGLGNVALERSDDAVARVRFEEALPLFQRSGSVLGEAHCIKGFGDIALLRSDYTAAHSRYEEALTLYRRVRSVLGEANCIQGLGDVARQRPDPETAAAKFAEALGLYQRIHEPYSIGEAQLRLARLAPKGSVERLSHLRAARQAWESINRLDLVEKLRMEFGEIP